MKHESATEMRRRTGLAAFFGLSGVNKLVLAEALATLALVSLAIRLLPFRTVVKWAKAGAAAPAMTADEKTMVIRCRWAVEKWAERVPWRTVCFQKGLALHIMLRRRGIDSTLHYGVMQNAEDGLKAHVWISESGLIVMGGEIAADYQELASFPAPAEASKGR